MAFECSEIDVLKPGLNTSLFPNHGWHSKHDLFRGDKELTLPELCYSYNYILVQFIRFLSPGTLLFFIIVMNFFVRFFCPLVIGHKSLFLCCQKRTSASNTYFYSMINHLLLFNVVF